MIETVVKFNSVKDVKEFVYYANMHDGDITIYSSQNIINGKSIMDVFSMNLSKPMKVEITGTMSQMVKDGIGKFVVQDYMIKSNIDD